MSESTTKTAIITAVLTGVFTVVAGVATYWFTTKEPELAFSVVGGPVLSNVTGAKRIFVVEVRNSGRKEIAQTLIQLALKTGELSEVATEANPGVKLTEERSQRQVDIRADLLNPGDIVKVSFLASLAAADTEPKIVVRAPGVLAVAESKEQQDLFNFSKGKNSNLLALLASAVAAVVSVLFFLLSRSRLSRILGVSSINPSMEQAEVGAFICGACQLYEEADYLRFGGNGISYRGTADYLQHQAARAEPENRKRYIIALKALLLNEWITRKSLVVIRKTIDSVSGNLLSEEEFKEIRIKAIDEGDDPAAWREKIAAYVKEKLEAN